MNRLPFVVLGAAAAALIVCPFYFEHSTRGFLRIETVHAVAFSGQPAPVQPSMTAQQNAWHSLNIFAGQATGTTNKDDGIFAGTPGNSNTWVNACELISGLCPVAGVRPAPAAFAVAGDFAAMSPHSGQPPRLGGGGPLTVVAPPILSLLYNSTAASDVQTQCGPIPSAACVKGITFSRGAMIGRFAWLDISPGASCVNADIGVFQPSAPAVPKDVEIQTDEKPCHPPAGISTVQLSQFFSHKVNSDNLKKAFQATHSALKFTNGSTAVLMGFHMMRKLEDGKTWSWSTFWWSSNPAYTPASSITGFSCATNHACPDASAFSSNYVMSTTEDPTGQETYGKLTNFYVDKNNQDNSNCIVCHKYAMTPVSPNAYSGGTRCGDQNPASLTQQQLQQAMTRYQGSGNGVRISTDMVWSLAETHQGAKSNLCP